MFIIMSVGAGIIALTSLMLLLTLPSSSQSKNLFGGKSSVSDVLDGRLHKSFEDPSRDNFNNGLRATVDKDGYVTFIPNGTVSNHAMRKALET